MLKEETKELAEVTHHEHFEVDVKIRSRLCRLSEAFVTRSK